MISPGKDENKKYLKPPPSKNHERLGYPLVN